MEWPAKILACKYDVVTRAWAVAHELVGKFSLGINPDDRPRWR